jgi:hypothetical protein
LEVQNHWKEGVDNAVLDPDIYDMKGTLDDSSDRDGDGPWGGCHCVSPREKYIEIEHKKDQTK